MQCVSPHSSCVRLAVAIDRRPVQEDLSCVGVGSVVVRDSGADSVHYGVSRPEPNVVRVFVDDAAH